MNLHSIWPLSLFAREHSNTATDDLLTRADESAKELAEEVVGTRKAIATLIITSEQDRLRVAEQAVRITRTAEKATAILRRGH